MTLTNKKHAYVLEYVSYSWRVLNLHPCRSWNRQTVGLC